MSFTSVSVYMYCICHLRCSYCTVRPLLLLWVTAILYRNDGGKSRYFFYRRSATSLICMNLMCKCMFYAEKGANLTSELQFMFDRLYYIIFSKLSILFFGTPYLTSSWRWTHANRTTVTYSEYQYHHIISQHQTILSECSSARNK